ncbi:MAG: ABC transporter ATP-binding protein [SAR202 cluster bacterium]|nr:ABC transporter ATP-binding protein [SAR202 cluster bacterium]
MTNKKMAQIPSPRPPAIVARGLHKSYGRAGVLRGLDLDVPWGEVVVVLGANGSGKTTLMRVLATLTRPDDGTVQVAGLDPYKLGRQVRSQVGVVTHDPLLYDDLTGYENLRFVTRMFGLDRSGERIDVVAGRLGLSARLHQRVGTLSHGLKKRFTIARALLHDPKILLMDEPESGLDQESQITLDTLIRDPAMSFRSVLITTHSAERAAAVGDRIAILARGLIAHTEPIGRDTDPDAIRRLYAEYAGAVQ